MGFCQSATRRITSGSLAFACIFVEGKSSRMMRLVLITVAVAAAVASHSSFSSAKAARPEGIVSPRDSLAPGIFAEWSLPAQRHYIVALSAFAIAQTLLIVVLLRRRAHKDQAGPAESKK